MTPIRILIADDHSIVRRGLQQIVAMRPGWKVVAEVSAADDVLPALRSGTIDMVILDVSLGLRSGIDLLGHIRAEFPALPVLMLSMHAEEQYAIRCLRAGASGYFPDVAVEKLQQNFEIIIHGERVVKEKRG